MSRQLTATVAIVTGASSGIGHATARELADRGACVVLVARRRDRLVNNAGPMLLGPVTGADVADWERMIAINQKGLLHMTNAALRHLQTAAQQGPREVADIVNISSIAGRVAWNGYGSTT